MLITGIVIVGLLILLIIFLRRDRLLSKKLERIYREDALKYIYEQNTMGSQATLSGLKGSLGISQAAVRKIVTDLEKSNLIHLTSAGIELTDQGKSVVLEIIRAHRIWETYLSAETELPFHKVHQYADQKEHDLKREQIEALDAHLGFPRFDPHGDPIPTGDGNIELLKAQSLNDWPEDKEGQIVHIEDEPLSIARKLFNLGLRVNDLITVLKKSPGQLQVSHKGKEFKLDSVSAANIQVKSPEKWQPPAGPTLVDLATGQEAIIKSISPQIRGLARRRLLDLGFTPGTKVKKILVSSFGNDPMAFEVRGAKIALRKEQAANIFVELNHQPKGQIHEQKTDQLS